jgi:hypothetical protein
MATLVVSFTVAGALLMPVSVETKPSTEPVIEKRVHIIYEESYAKPDKPPGKPDKPDKEATCFEFLGRGVKWKVLPQDILVATSDMQSGISDAADEWQTATSTDLFDSISVDATADLDTTTRDGRNEMSFGDYAQDGVIAVCYTWGIFGGPPGQRAIVEFDILFDTDFTWGDADIDPTVMDFVNIATHEMGHGLGLADMYESDCSEVTMYGYGTEGETKKRTLHAQDILGIQELYGE